MKLKCIMLIDDNPYDNFYHERVIHRSDMADVVITKTKANDALDYLRTQKENNYIQPDLIFLDINMPDMNGWEFLQAYYTLDKTLQSRAIIMMLTTSENPDDKLKSSVISIVTEFKTKPLTKEMLKEIYSSVFSNASSDSHKNNF